MSAEEKTHQEAVYTVPPTTARQQGTSYTVPPTTARQQGTLF